MSFIHDIYGFKKSFRHIEKNFGRIWQDECSCTDGRWSSVSPALGCPRSPNSLQWGPRVLMYNLLEI